MSSRGLLQPKSQWLLNQKEDEAKKTQCVVLSRHRRKYKADMYSKSMKLSTLLSPLETGLCLAPLLQMRASLVLRTGLAAESVALISPVPFRYKQATGKRCLKLHLKDGVFSPSKSTLCQLHSRTSTSVQHLVHFLLPKQLHRHPAEREGRLVCLSFAREMPATWAGT